MTTGWLQDVLNIGSWGEVIADQSATVTVTADQVNAGLILLAGRAGVQSVTLPTSGLTPGASVLVVADDANVSVTNAITIDATTPDVTLTAQDQTAAILWTGARWVKL